MIRNLQALRALAAYMVVIYHFFGLQVAPTFPSAKYLTFGASGVDIFFVISGFIMVTTTMSRETGAVEFFLHRIARIVPVYWLVTTLLFFIALMGFHPVGIMRIQSDWLIQSLLFIPFDRDGRIEPLIAAGWTLNYEMFFYCAFALSLVLKQAVARTALLCATMTALALAHLQGNLGLYANFYTMPIILEFAFGCALGYFFQRTETKIVRAHLCYLLIATGIAIIATAQVVGLAFDARHEIGGFVRPLVWGAAGLTIVAGFVFLERSGHIVPFNWIVQLGNASYSIYLIHVLLLHATAKALALVLPLGITFLFFNLFISVIASAVFGLALYYKIELPANRRLRAMFDGIMRAPERPHRIY